jgi:hypothetical protein
MLKGELECVIGREATADEYDAINTVYMCYDESATHETIGRLYKAFGMKVFYDLLPRALKIQELEQELLKAKSQIKTLQGRD